MNNDTDSKKEQSLKLIEIDKLIHKFLHPLFVFSGNSQLLAQMGELLQKTMTPRTVPISDARQLGEELKSKLLGLKDALGSLDENAVKRSLERAQMDNLEKQLSTIINVLDHDLTTETTTALLDVKIRDTAIWILDELEKVNNRTNNTIKSLVKYNFFEFIQGILLRHIIRAARILKGETQILEREVEALRTYTGLEKGRKYSFRTADIGKLLERNIELFEPVFAEKDIQVDYRPRGQLIAEISRGDIERVISNLLHNVRKYAYKGEGRFVKIKAREIQPQNHVEISIQSYGTPIKKEEIESGKLFQFGARGELAYESARDGTGVGLADAKEVVDSHGGEISLKSIPTADDGNPPQYKVPYLTTVTIRIPRRRIK